MTGDIIGYVSQCEACGQRVVTRTRHATYRCPPCAEIACADANDINLRGIRG